MLIVANDLLMYSEGARRAAWEKRMMYIENLLEYHAERTTMRIMISGWWASKKSDTRLNVMLPARDYRRFRSLWDRYAGELRKRGFRVRLPGAVSVHLFDLVNIVIGW